MDHRLENWNKDARIYPLVSIMLIHKEETKTIKSGNAIIYDKKSSAN